MLFRDSLIGQNQGNPITGIPTLDFTNFNTRATRSDGTRGIQSLKPTDVTNTMADIQNARSTFSKDCLK